MTRVEARTLRSLIYLAAGIGLIISLFAAAEFFNASLRAVCSVNAFLSCSAVDTSGRTSTLGIPDYLWGIGGFVLIIVVAALAERQPGDRRRVYALLALTSLGVAVSLYFLYVELALIHALCIVCAGAYVFGFLAWGGSVALAVRARQATDPEVEATGGPAEDA